MSTLSNVKVYYQSERKVRQAVLGGDGGDEF